MQIEVTKNTTVSLNPLATRNLPRVFIMKESEIMIGDLVEQLQRPD